MVEWWRGGYCEGNLGLGDLVEGHDDRASRNYQGVHGGRILLLVGIDPNVMLSLLAIHLSTVTIDSHHESWS